SLGVWVSEDEGKTWPHMRRLEHDAPGRDAGSYSYPSIIQAHDGTIHVTYSYSPPGHRRNGESIKHAQFDEQWLLSADRQPGVGSRLSAVGYRQSAIGNRQPAVG